MNEIPKDLVEIYEQVVEKESCVLNKIYDDISHLEDVKLRMQYAIKSEESSKDEEISESTEKANLNEKFDDLQDSLIKQSCITNLIRDMLYKNQVRKSIFSKIDLTKKLNSDDDLFKIIDNGKKCADYSEELCKVAEERNEIQMEIFKLNKKYIQILHSIQNKWSILKGRKTTVDSHDKELKSLSDKVEKREMKVQILIEILKNIMSSTNEQWQENGREVPTLLLCDAFYSDNTEEVAESLDLLQKARNIDAKKKKSKISSYMDSTKN